MEKRKNIYCSDEPISQEEAVKNYTIEELLKMGRETDHIELASPLFDTSDGDCKSNE